MKAYKERKKNHDNRRVHGKSCCLFKIVSEMKSLKKKKRLRKVEN